MFGGGVDLGTAQALDYLDQRDGAEEYKEEKVDLPWLRKTALNFEKKISKNAEQRAKYEDDPTKFMESEADLDDAVKALSILSEHSELYEEFAKLGCAGSLVGLLAHENTDIAIGAIQILAELTDEDVEAEQEQWDAIVDAFLEADLLSLLVGNFSRFNETNEDDRSGVYHSLSVIENLCSKEDMADRLVKETEILQWLLKRIQSKEKTVGQNKQYAAEVLSLLVQQSKRNRRKAVDLNSIDTLLGLLSAYRKRDPEKDSEEEEYAENLFDALTCIVDEAEGKSSFNENEGVELMLLLLRDGKFSKPRALRVLDHAAGGAAGGEICERIVEAAGLKTIFSMFMKKQEHSVTENLLGILTALLRSLPGDSPARIRTLAKFMEKDHEKIDRLVTLRRDYASKVAAVDTRIDSAKAEMDEEEQESMAAEWLSRRLDAGLYSLQVTDIILAWLVVEDGGARKKISARLTEGNGSLGDIKATLQEQLDGAAEDPEAPTEDEQGNMDMLRTLIDCIS